MSVKYRVVVEKIESKVLAGNPLGDPTTRELHLVVPDTTTGPLPLVFVLSGFSGVGKMALADDPWQEGLAQRVERLSAEGKLGAPAIFALPDCWTRYGGSQYLDSAATGAYETHLWHELLPAIRAAHPVGKVGVVGKSSGGFGAIVQAMRHPEIVSAVGVHSGDMAFEYCYQADFPKTFRTLAKHGGLKGFFDAFAASNKKRDGRWIDTLNIVAMAACYSPDAAAERGFALPFDLETGALVEAVWRRWLAFDPVRMLDEPRHVAALKAMKLLFLDAGTRDEYALDLGARIFARRLRELGVAHRHEEFDDGHFGITYRYDVSLPLLVTALAGA